MSGAEPFADLLEAIATTASEHPILFLVVGVFAVFSTSVHAFIVCGSIALSLIENLRRQAIELLRLWHRFHGEIDRWKLLLRRIRRKQRAKKELPPL